MGNNSNYSSGGAVRENIQAEEISQILMFFFLILKILEHTRFMLLGVNRKHIL